MSRGRLVLNLLSQCRLCYITLGGIRFRPMERRAGLPAHHGYMPPPLGVWIQFCPVFTSQDVRETGSKAASGPCPSLICYKAGNLAVPTFPKG